MPFPNDLDNVVAFKIHPALGVARVANNDDVYEFFEYEAVREAGDAPTLKYMSDVDGNHVMMRQAVKYRIFAYAEDGSDLGELSQDVMEALGVSPTWTAKVANRKLNNHTNGSTPITSAEASATLGTQMRLEGQNPWRGTTVWLGNIAGDGTFTPAKGGVYRETNETTIPPYLGNWDKDNGILDTTCDGAIDVELEGVGDIPVVPAAIIVAPQQHSPDVNPGMIADDTNRDFVKETRGLLGIPEGESLVGHGYAMDLAIMATINGEYNPGMELCLNPGHALPSPANAFYPRGEGHIADAEIRPSYEDGHAVHGALTAGLCSAWQTDLNACLNYWTAEYPPKVYFNEDPDERQLSRKNFKDAEPRMDNPEDLNIYIDQMGVARNVDDDIDFLSGTERDADDNMGGQPVAPFPLDPER